MAPERVETTVVTGFPAAQSGSGVGCRKPTGRGAEGGSSGRANCLGGADRRAGVSGVRAVRPLGPLGCVLRRPSVRSAAAALGQALSAPPRDVSGSEPAREGPRGPSLDTRPVPGLGAPRTSALRRGAEGAALRARGHSLAAAPLQLVSEAGNGNKM